MVSDDWQAREREVDADVAAGEYTDHADLEAFLRHLHSLGARENEPPDTTPADHLDGETAARKINRMTGGGP